MGVVLAAGTDHLVLEVIDIEGGFVLFLPDLTGKRPFFPGLLDGDNLDIMGAEKVEDTLDRPGILDLFRQQFVQVTEADTAFGLSGFKKIFFEF